jgi:2-dehydro-3-deoxyphosphogluconate aldolase / (4S)-4-hydroxy-2-oxoglutarate aldolase
LQRFASMPHLPCSMTKPEIIQRLLDPGIIAILRADSSEQLVAVTEALAEGGITAVEVTMTTPNALQVIGDVSARLGERVLMGVGTVLDPETCRAAILAGAEFVVTPVTKPDVIRMCNRYGKPIANGAFTPTEALLGYESGADFIKLFPAEHAGPAYIKSILAPLPMLQIIPTGGVTPETVGDFLRAGCVALGAGSTLVAKAALARGDLRAITRRAEEFVAAARAARA